jgi:hypothetical protein
VVTVLIHNDAHDAVSGATVTGTWSTGGTGSCVTASNGRCAITSTPMKKSVASARFMVTGIAGTNMSYPGGANHDPDGDSDGTAITINR